MQMQLHALKGVNETIAALKEEAALYRAQSQTVANTLPQLRQITNQREYQLKQVLQDGESSSSQKRGAKSAASRANLAVDQAISQAMMLEQRAATIEGSIISLTLQAQVQAAAPAPAPVAAPALDPIIAPTVAPAPVRLTAPVVVAPPATVTEPDPAAGRMTKASAAVSSPQVPEAPLPVTLPPISRMQPAAAASAPISEPAPATDLQKLLPWALAAGAAFLFMNKPKRKRRYA
jgi:hypothetical protein